MLVLLSEPELEALIWLFDRWLGRWLVRPLATCCSSSDPITCSFDNDLDVDGGGGCIDWVERRRDVRPLAGASTGCGMSSLAPRLVAALAASAVPTPLVFCFGFASGCSACCCSFSNAAVVSFERLEARVGFAGCFLPSRSSSSCSAVTSARVTRLCPRPLRPAAVLAAATEAV